MKPKWCSAWSVLSINCCSVLSAALWFRGSLAFCGLLLHSTRACFTSLMLCFSLVMHAQIKVAISTQHASRVLKLMKKVNHTRNLLMLCLWQQAAPRLKHISMQIYWWENRTKYAYSVIHSSYNTTDFQVLTFSMKLSVVIDFWSHSYCKCSKADI